MSYQLAKSVNDAGGRNKQTLQPSNSLWMAHWHCNSSKETRNHNAARDLKLQSATSGNSLKDVLQVSREMETRAFDVIGESSKMVLKSFRNVKKHNSLFKNGQGSDGMQELRIRPVFSNNLDHVKSFGCSNRIQFSSMIPGVPTVNEIASLERHPLGHDTLEDPPKSMKTHTSDTCALNFSSIGRDWFLKMQKCSEIAEWCSRYGHWGKIHHLGFCGRNGCGLFQVPSDNSQSVNQEKGSSQSVERRWQLQKYSGRN